MTYTKYPKDFHKNQLAGIDILAKNYKLAHGENIEPKKEITKEELRKEYKKEWVKKNIDRVREQTRIRVKRHREKIKQRQKEIE